MRLLMTTDTVGGVWTFTRELAAGLIDRGCEITLVSVGKPPSSEQLSHIKPLIATGRLTYAVATAALEWMPENSNAYSAVEPLLLELCRGQRPDALLLSQFCFGALPVDVLKIVIAHSDVLSWADAVGKAPLPPDAWLSTYLALVQRGLSGAHAVIAPSAAALRSTASHYRLLEDTAVVHNGRSLPAAVSFEGSRSLRAVTAGRMWDPAKHLDLLTEVNSPIPLLVAGEQDASAAVAGSITMLGHQGEAQLLELFHQSAIYICCSRYEPFGLAPLEAALCGCALLVNDLPSLREVWGDAALYFTDASALEELLCQLAADPTRLSDAQQAARQRAGHFTRERMVDAYLAAIARCTDKRTRTECHAA